MKTQRRFFSLAFMALSLSMSAQKKGDVNRDGVVDISDVVAVINTIAGETAFKTTADVNGDNTIDISDVVAIINIIANGGNGDNPNPIEEDPAVEAGICPDNHHPHVINMGLAGKWACCNVGASAPWEYGGYYAWGETEEKSTYNWSSYIHCDGSYSTCHNLGSDIAGTQYDVAHVQWGGSWRMPSFDQIQLLNNCSSKWTTVNGINGRKFIASNGNSIFLPAAGYRWYDGTVNVGSHGYYWSSTQYPGYSYDACYLDFGSGDTYWLYGHRYYGQSVRPVTEQ